MPKTWKKRQIINDAVGRQPRAFAVYFGYDATTLSSTGARCGAKEPPVLTRVMNRPDDERVCRVRDVNTHHEPVYRLPDDNKSDRCTVARIVVASDVNFGAPGDDGNSATVHRTRQTNAHHTDERSTAGGGGREFGVGSVGLLGNAR